MTDAERDKLWVERMEKEDEQARQQAEQYERNVQRMFEQNERVIELLREISDQLKGLGGTL